MAYAYQSQTANDVADFFTDLEAFLVARGWTVESGSGSQSIVFSSPGELGGRTKLFIRIRQDGGNPERVYSQCRDDAAGTNSTTDPDDAYTHYMTAPGGGAIPFTYFLSADKDKVIMGFKSGASYSGTYIGIVEPFAVSIPDEEYQYIVAGLHRMDQTYFGRVLRDYANNWDQLIHQGYLTDTWQKDQIDDDCALFGLHVRRTANINLIGECTDVSGRMNVLAGVNPEDIITSGFTGATSTWIVLGTGTLRWAMRTGGNVPTGALEGAYFSHTKGLATSQANFEATLLAFMQAIGWTKVANPSPAFPIDFFWNSAGESGSDNIYIHHRYETAQKRYETNVSDDTALTHVTPYNFINIEVGDFPTYYWLSADRDCLVMVLEVAGEMLWHWAGHFQMFHSDPTSLATPYKVGNAGGATPLTPNGSILRAHEGTWSTGLSRQDDYMIGSGPNALDGATYPVWPLTFFHVNVPIGVCKYLNRIDGTGISMNDGVSIGSRSFIHLGNRNAIREV